MDYCGCLENSWVNSPGGSNPSPSAKKVKSLFISRSVRLYFITEMPTEQISPRLNSNVDSARQLLEASQEARKPELAFVVQHS